MSDQNLTTGQTFRQHGGRLLHILAGEVVSTVEAYEENAIGALDLTPRDIAYMAAFCGASYQPEKGDAAEVSDRKVCSKCQAQAPAPAPRVDEVPERASVREAIEGGTRADYRKALRALDAVTEREADWRSIGQALNIERSADKRGTPAQIATPWLRELVGLPA